MEQNTPLMAKKIWNIMRVAFFMLRKGICKRKILLDLNLAMKRGLDGQSKPQEEYEFSCSNTPLYRQYFTTNKRSKNHHDKNYSIEDVNNMFDMMMLNSSEEIVAASPVSELRSGLGFHSAVKQLRITDSPFPLQSGENNGDKHVDEAAAEFIKRFYSQLKQEKYY
ncbi:hypothetical protein RND81_14G157200 [Saponaria officinalis]|uniref:Avr9/Cf-9 rapidly elicited protein 146 n=1 Tax=Saponaria officinalis TaxID=3572 RepID=A0AAW1GUE7_SAPOF